MPGPVSASRQVRQKLVSPSSNPQINWNIWPVSSNSFSPQGEGELGVFCCCCCFPQLFDMLVGIMMRRVSEIYQPILCGWFCTCWGHKNFSTCFGISHRGNWFVYCESVCPWGEGESRHHCYTILLASPYSALSLFGYCSLCPKKSLPTLRLRRNSMLFSKICLALDFIPKFMI